MSHGVPRDTVRQWLYVYRSFGSEVLLTMDGRQARYTYEQKVAAARAVVEDGTVRALPRGRRGGALGSKSKGGPKGSKARPRERARERGLEERCRMWVVT